MIDNLFFSDRNMFSIVRNILTRLPVIIPKPIVSTACYHALTKTNILPQTTISQLLAPKVINIVPVCGFKVKGRLRRRCKDCYFVVREQRLYVICKTHPKHKQMSMVKKEKNTWILTHATMGKVRPW